MRQQVGALPIRWNGDELSVLLVTSRETQRWIIPKGWRMRGRSDAEAAAQEALEEAGVRGRVRAEPIGRYRYLKRRTDADEDCEVTTFLLEVVDELQAFPEMDERRRNWFTPAEAADCADDEGLREILRDLETRLRAERHGDAASDEPIPDASSAAMSKAAKAKGTRSKAARLKAADSKMSKSKVGKSKVDKSKAGKSKAGKSKAGKSKGPAKADPTLVDPAGPKSLQGDATKSKPAKPTKAKARSSKRREADSTAEPASPPVAT